MAQKSNNPKTTKSASAFDALVSLRKPANHSDSQTGDQPGTVPPRNRAAKSSPEPSTGLAKSVDPDYIKFTTYVRKDTHRAVKVKITERDEELSDLVEQLLQSWLQKNK